MIAVFTRSQKDFDDLLLSPSNEFKRIRNSEDLRGLRFTGVIRTPLWSKNKDVRYAYSSVLSYRQPELFK